MWVPFVKPYLFFGEVEIATLSPRLEGHPFAVGLLPQEHALEEVSRSQGAAGKP